MQGPHDGQGKGENIPKKCEGHVPLELQEEEAQEVSWQLPQEVTRQLTAEVTKQLAGKLPARLANELTHKPTLECMQGQTGASHCHLTEEVTLWRCQQAFEQGVLEQQDPQHEGQGQNEETQFSQEQVVLYLPTPEGVYTLLYSVFCNFIVSLCAICGIPFIHFCRLMFLCALNMVLNLHTLVFS